MLSFDFPKCLQQRRANSLVEIGVHAVFRGELFNIKLSLFPELQRHECPSVRCAINRSSEGQRFQFIFLTHEPGPSSKRKVMRGHISMGDMRP